jgi:aromatic ring-opening dioxygenase LigB subunit
MIKFASISPHPPILLPSVGSEQDRLKLKKTIESLEYLAKSFKKAKPDHLIISSPHPDWGFKVPLYFIANDFKAEIEYFLTELEPPKFYFDKGKQFYLNLEKDKSYGLIASGDLSHCLKEDGPYGFYPDGPKFDKALIKYLKEKDIENFLKLDEMFPQAGECGLRSFSFLWGMLEESKLDWQPEILSYQGPFGVGYLVASIQIKNQ